MRVFPTIMMESRDSGLGDQISSIFMDGGQSHPGPAAKVDVASDVGRVADPQGGHGEHSPGADSPGIRRPHDPDRSR